MGQAPATPKLTRAYRLLAHRTFGLSQNTSRLAPSEVAALKLSTARAGEVWSAPKEVVFLIPLVGPEAVGNWDQVTRLLQDTLASFQCQTHQSWRAIVCCQTTPPLPDDPRVTFLQFDEICNGNDKWHKLAALYTHLETWAEGSGLAMTFDADDLAAPDLVETLLKCPTGALITRGIIYDQGRDKLALARPQSILQPGAKAFWKLCGSCAALPFDTEQPSANLQFRFLKEMSQHEHRMVPYLSRLAGTRLLGLGAEPVLYRLNHGENFGARRGRVSFKTRFVDRFEIKDATQSARVRALFGF